MQASGFATNCLFSLGIRIFRSFISNDVFLFFTGLVLKLFKLNENDPDYAEINEELRNITPAVKEIAFSPVTNK